MATLFPDRVSAFLVAKGFEITRQGEGLTSFRSPKGRRVSVPHDPALCAEALQRLLDVAKLSRADFDAYCEEAPVRESDLGRNRDTLDDIRGRLLKIRTKV